MLKRVESGIPGFDSLLDGGIPEGNLVILSGRAGTGKTIFAVQYLYHGSAKLGERTLYVSFIEEKARLARNVKRFGFHVEEMESKGLMKILNLPIPQAGQYSKFLEDITKIFEEYKPARAVLDPISAVTMPFTGTKSELQNFVHLLLSKIATFSDCTTLLVSEVAASSDIGSAGIEEFMADGIVVFYYLMRGKAKIKAVEARKMRGTRHSNQAVLLEITDNGIVIDPDIELTA